MTNRRIPTSLHIERLPLGGYVVCEPALSNQVLPAFLAAFSDLKSALEFVEKQMSGAAQ